MSQWSFNEALRPLYQLGSPEALLESVSETSFPPRPTNAHIHLPPNFSAFRTVTEAVSLATEQGIRVLGATNYYDYRVYSDFAERAIDHGIYPLFGLEIITLDDDLLRAGIKVNDPGNPGKFYVCGKGILRFDPMSEEATALLEVIRGNDAERMEKMVAALATVFATNGLPTNLDASTIRQKIAYRHDCPLDTVYLQERHVAQAFQEEFFLRVLPVDRPEVLARIFGATSKSPQDPAGVQGEIRSHLMKAGRPAFVAETFVDFDHAYKLILALGGIPCYPTLADGAKPLCGFEEPVESLIDSIQSRGIYTAELIPIRNSPDVLRHYVTAMRNAGIIVTAGTEHNTPDLIPLEPTCLNGEPIPGDVLAIFWEGACVLLGHQHRLLHGQTGYVDDNGQLNADFTDNEVRIKAFAALGAAVLQRFAG